MDKLNWEVVLYSIHVFLKFWEISPISFRSLLGSTSAFQKKLKYCVLYRYELFFWANMVSKYEGANSLKQILILHKGSVLFLLRSLKQIFLNRFKITKSRVWNFLFNLTTIPMDLFHITHINICIYMYNLIDNNFSVQMTLCNQIWDNTM